MTSTLPIFESVLTVPELFEKYINYSNTSDQPMNTDFTPLDVIDHDPMCGTKQPVLSRDASESDNQCSDETDSNDGYSDWFGTWSRSPTPFTPLSTAPQSPTLSNQSTFPQSDYFTFSPTLYNFSIPPTCVFSDELLIGALNIDSDHVIPPSPSPLPSSGLLDVDHVRSLRSPSLPPPVTPTPPPISTPTLANFDKASQVPKPEEGAGGQRIQGASPSPSCSSSSLKRKRDDKDVDHLDSQPERKPKQEQEEDGSLVVHNEPGSPLSSFSESDMDADSDYADADIDGGDDDSDYDDGHSTSRRPLAKRRRTPPLSHSPSPTPSSQSSSKCPSPSLSIVKSKGIRKRRGGRAKCSFCSETFTRDADRVRHEIKHSEAEAPESLQERTCIHCDKVLARRDARLRHEKDSCDVNPDSKKNKRRTKHSYL
ncbi:hypothetical protein BDN72DRAFT_958481 [Pluteus cervinus]|uniref:Uncharacterized protein n=1 Tax=Pluteus cervinus TaxID=181527 RepID=A0ACD3AYN2_9AGAR|nr:hypothetical protein BDN72DRAFT_958481 [Pluteus cervinus]